MKATPDIYVLSDEEAKTMERLTNDIQEVVKTAKFDALHQEVRLPEYLQLELDFMDEMFERRMEDPRA